MKPGYLHLRNLRAGLGRCESGQALIELALIVPVLLLLLMGAGETARLAYAAIEVTHAARAGAAYGIQNVNTMGDRAGIQNAAKKDAPDLTGLTTAESYSYVCSDQSAYSSATGSCLDGADVLTYLHVTATTTFNPLIGFPGLPTSFTLTGTSIDQCLYL
jgi:Flp pilus assembly protein TadG